MRLAITDESSLKTAAARGAAVLRAGGLVAFPTETVYGLGADATNATAVARVFEAKERPHFDPLIVHLGAVDWLERIVENAPDGARRLAEEFWPGPLTLVLPKRAVIHDLVTAGLPTVAVRVPAHPVAHAMIVEAGVPVAAPSANRFGRISPTTGPAVEEELGGRVELILDAGPTRHGIESTIVAFDADGPRVLRPGPVTLEQLTGSLGREVRFPVRASGTPASPGMMESHYAPRTPLRLMDPALTLAGRVGLLSLAKKRPAPGFAAVETLSVSGDLREAAASLFAALRRLDAAGLDLIVAEPVPEQGLGVAIMDRLRKAAGPRR